MGQGGYLIHLTMELSSLASQTWLARLGAEIKKKTPARYICSSYRSGSFPAYHLGNEANSTNFSVLRESFRMAGTLVSSGSYSGLKGGGASAQCFRITYHSLEGYANLLGRKTEVGGARGHCCLGQLAYNNYTIFTSSFLAQALIRLYWGVKVWLV